MPMHTFRLQIEVVSHTRTACFGSLADGYLCIHPFCGGPLKEVSRKPMLEHPAACTLPTVKHTRCAHSFSLL